MAKKKKKSLQTSDEIKKQLTSFLEGPKDDKLLAEASDPKTSPERLAELAKSEDQWVRLAALKNPNAPADAFLDLAFS